MVIAQLKLDSKHFFRKTAQAHARSFFVMLMDSRHFFRKTAQGSGGPCGPLIHFLCNILHPHPVHLMLPNPTHVTLEIFPDCRLTGCQFNWLKKPVEEPLEKPLEISYTGKSPKMGSLDMSQNQIWISSGFSSSFSSVFLAN